MVTAFESPLVEIEERVLVRAKEESLDTSHRDTTARLRELLEQEVARWRVDFKHGLRPYDLPDPERVVERARRNLTGYGPLEPLLADDDVWEVMINAPDQIFVKRHSGVSGYHDEAFHDDDHVIRTLTKILDDASTSHRKLDPSEGLQDAQLDDGARLHIVHRDVGRGSHLLVNIRRFTGVAFRSLDELVERGMMTAEVAAFLRAAVRAQLSVVFAGPPGSGKTTLLSCCTAELDPSLRVVTAEEVFEVDVPLPNVASMQTRAARPDRPAIDLRRLVAGFLRMAPDVAIVGEVRDQEALPLLLTLSSGVTGYTTIHAGPPARPCPVCGSSVSWPTRAPNCRWLPSTRWSPKRSTSWCTAPASTGCRRSRRWSRSRNSRPARAHRPSPSLSSSRGTRRTRRCGGPAACRCAAGGPWPRPVTSCERCWTPRGAWPAVREDGHDLGPRRLPDSHSSPPTASSWPTPRSRSGGEGSGSHRRCVAARAARGVRSVTSSSRPDSTACGRSSSWPSPLVLAVVAGAFAFAVWAAPLPALVVATVAATVPLAAARTRRRARQDHARDAWPRMIEEIRLQAVTLGRPIPQALLAVGLAGPDETRPAFAAAQREWLISTDFARTLDVLKAHLADPTADAVCETLLVAHDIGGTDVDQRLRALTEDRIQDLQGRKDARSKQAGVRFARLFVLFVPIGMALVGLSIGDGRAAYRSPGGQVAILVAFALMGLCWGWASRLLRLPEEERVFVGTSGEVTQ
jgi:pilus assembly protein CpaF